MAIDVAEDQFEKIVLEGSRKGPVVVDFWASWCAPCRSLGPILERVAQESGVTLAKVDVDASPNIAGAFGIRSIPTVYAFKDGMIVDQFVGALPEQLVRRFFAGLQPGEADVLAARAAASSDDEEVERLYREALEHERAHRASVVGLARLLSARGEREEARALLERISEDEDVARLRASLELQRGDEEIESLRVRVADDPDDLKAAVALGRAEAASGKHAEALERLLAAVRDGSEEARRVMVDVFRVLGDDHSLTREFRAKLAAALF